jgi:hypothetical protein
MKPASEIVASKKARLESRLVTLKETILPDSVETCPANGLLSHLERLPIELVQQVFFHCLEVDMIKASPIISKMLSTESTYRLLVLFAFFDDDGLHPVETQIFKPVNYRELSIQEKVRLQESILSCRWCTLKRIQDCMPALTRLKIVQEWHKENNVTKDWSGGLATASIEGIDPPALPSLHNTIALEHYFHARKQATDAENTAEAEQPEYFPWLTPYTVQRDENGSILKRVPRPRPGHRLVFPSTLAVRHIPDRLLTGAPWTESNLDFLKLLRQGFRHLTRDFVLHISPTALFSGMASAIKETNHPALLVLLELHDAAFHIQKTSISGQQVQDFNPNNQRYTIPHTHRLPLPLFHLPLTHPPPTASSLLSLLVRAGLDSIPQDDAILTKWALTSSPEADPIAAFLLKYMEGAFTAYWWNGIFRHGAFTGDLLPRYGFSRGSTRSFAEEIGYEVPTRDWQFSVVVESGEVV